MMRWMLPAALFWGLALVVSAQAQMAADPAGDNQGIIADISHRNIAVTAGFTGATTTLFGALPQEGDVVVVVSGPPDTITVRRKERIGGVWINHSYMSFLAVPGYYWVGGSRPLADIAGAEWLTAQHAGLDNLRFSVADASDFTEIDLFRRQLVSLRQEDGVFLRSPGEVSVMGGKLYRADVTIPDNAPTGTYTATTYLFVKGQLVDIQKTPLLLRKEGAMAGLSGLSQQYSLLYALLAVTMALLSGWISSVLMRRS